MREIKFRTYLQGIGFKYFNINENVTVSIKNGVNQFTGLTDKLGAEIYEGDIVIQYEIPNKPFEIRQEIFFSDGMYCVGKKGERETPLYLETNTQYRKQYVNLIEVIGNIHENPELLKDRI